MFSKLFLLCFVSGIMSTPVPENEPSIKITKKEFSVDHFVGPMTKETLSKLGEIENLSLKNSNITSYPSQVFSLLPNLKKIVVENCEFNLMDPDIYKDANKLEEILFASNKVPELPLTLLRTTTFEKIIISDQPQVKEIPKNFANGTKNLKHFACSKCSIQNVESEAFNSLTKLETLDLSKNSIKELPKNVFEPLKNLKHLNLHGNSLRKFDVNDLNGLENLISIDLSDNPITELNLLDFEKVAPKLLNLNLIGTKIPENQIDEHVKKTKISIVADRVD